MIGWDFFLTPALTSLVLRQVLYPKPTRQEKLIDGYKLRELSCKIRWLNSTGLFETASIIKLDHDKKSHNMF